MNEQNNQYKREADWRSFIRETLFDGKNVSVKRFEIFIIIIILLSVVAALLETVSGISTQYHKELYNLEWLFTIIFTIEYLLRVITAKSSLKYIFSVEGIVDLLATLPLYVRLIFGGKEYLSLFRVLRIVRIFSRLHRFTKSMKKTRYFYNKMLEHMSTNEKILVYFKKSRRTYLIPYSLSITIFIISVIEIVSQSISFFTGIQGIWLKAFSYSLFILSTIVIIVFEVKILFTRYAITNHRVIMSEGILYENFKSTNFHFVADTILLQTFIDKFLGLGTISITTTGSDVENLHLKKIRHSIEIKKLIQDSIIRSHSTNSYGINAQSTK